MKTTGSRIRDARVALKLTQTALGNLVGVSQSTIAFWENDENDPRANNLDKLSSALKKDPEFLVYGAESAKGAVASSGRATTFVSAYIGDEQALHALDAGQAKALGRVSALVDPNEAWNAAVVRGNAMLPLYRDGDILLYREPRSDHLRKLLGVECVIWVLGGKTLVRRLMAGSTRDTYTLIGPNQSSLDDVKVKQAAPVEAVKRFIPTRP